MTEHNDKLRKLLRYQEGEQIIKQGDYGISVYKILSGKVQVFRKTKDVEVPLATLGSGGILGEMAFLSRDAEVRSASAKALEDAELEVWHPRELSMNYEQTPPVIKTIIDQALNRLRRMNKYMDRLAVQSTNKTSKKRLQDSDAWKSKRMFYRKKVYVPCRYAPASRSKDFPFLKGNIKDLSMGGMCLEAMVKNEAATPHEAGEFFRIHAALPNGQDLNVTAQIVSVQKDRTTIRLGMKFKELADYQEAKKVLGFFLLPT